MVQVSNKINLLSRLAIAVIAGHKQQVKDTFQSNKDSNCNTEISAHRQAVACIRKVQAEYQMRGWMR
jgi:hypothetical protein